MMTGMPFRTGVCMRTDIPVRTAEHMVADMRIRTGVCMKPDTRSRTAEHTMANTRTRMNPRMMTATGIPVTPAAAFMMTTLTMRR